MPSIFEDEVTCETMNEPVWTKYGQLFDQETIQLQINAESRDFYTRPLFLNEIVPDPELKEIIFLIQEHVYEKNLLITQIMDFIVKNRSKLVTIDVLKLECQNRLSEI